MQNKEKLNNFWQETLKIGNLEFPRFMSAPIDGITDSPMRQLIREFSPKELLFTEMRHVASIVNHKTSKALVFKDIEHPLCFQISASKTDYVEKAVNKVLETDIKVFNLNAGCPAKNVIKSGAGSALMANIPELTKIIKLIVKTINNKIPLTLKIRAGFKEKNALYVSQLAQDLGVEAIIIHPRIQPEGFTSPLDFDLVKQIKETIKIPVIFSGNVNNFSRAKMTHEKTGVDGFMIGRALYGAPWKIKQIKEEAKGKTFDISTKQMLEYALKHLNLVSEYYGIESGFNVFKKQVVLYIRNIENASQMRQTLLRTQSAKEMENHLKQLYEKSNF